MLRPGLRSDHQPAPGPPGLLELEVLEGGFLVCVSGTQCSASGRPLDHDPAALSAFLHSQGGSLRSAGLDQA